MRNLFKKNKKGFTMAEMLVAVAVISAITAASTPAIRTQMEGAGMSPAAVTDAMLFAADAAGPEVAGLVQENMSVAVGTTADTSASAVSLDTAATSLEAYGVPILVHPR